MKRLSFYIVLLHGLFLGIAPASAKELTKNSATIPSGMSSHVWVINNQQKVQRQPFIWVANNNQQPARQQPFLQVLKSEKQISEIALRNSNKDRRDDLEPFEDFTRDTQKISGMFTLYRNKEKGKVYLEIKPQQLKKNYLATMTMESGIGERGIYSGMPLQDFLFYFQRVNNNLQFVVRNVNFRAREGDPQARSVARSFSDSVLYAIPIKSINFQSKSILVDLDDLLLTDFPGLSSSLSWMLEAPFQLDKDKSSFGAIKAFPENIEIESVYGFTGGGPGDKIPDIESLADGRALTLRVRYSFSQLPENEGYKPRFADERVGYFVTAYQDLSNDNNRDPFVRYVNRWHLEKQNPNSPLSRPKKPIVFWIENAVPVEYRDTIKQGVLMWNKAFEKSGFKDAIEVRQMPDNANWDPADVRYNTIRWINTIDGYFALGPSRVNPLTGQILDADVLVDASFVRSLKGDYRNIVQAQPGKNHSSLSAFINNRNVCAGGLQPKPKPSAKGLAKLAMEYDLCYGMEAAQNFAFGSLSTSLLQNTLPSSDDAKRYIQEYLRLIIAHEVGHTLGLRHNFRGSNLLQPQEMNNTTVTRSRGMTASVMDYLPPNIAPSGVKQGDYFPSEVGPYDDWAIQYGYTPSGAASAIAERRFLEQIASQSGKPELSYSPDEDRLDLDPSSDAWDHSGDVLEYSQWQLDNSRVMWDRLNKRFPIPGESFSDVSDRFNTVLGNYFRNVYFTTKFIGGQYFYRSYGGDRKGALPFEAVPVEQQRQALANLQKYVFADDAFNFPPELLNKLAPQRWYHWGSNIQFGRLDYPIHDMVLFMQSLVLRELLSGDRISRLRDIELKTQAGKSLTLPELFDTLQTDIWREVIKPDGKPMKISSLRRGLQREYLEILTSMVLRTEYVPEDARTLAWYKLKQLQEKLKGASSKDEYTKAHLMETQDRINKTLNAQLRTN